ncbi:MAG: hypothetical protein AAF327_18165 [Cyanobacteria bacterium P01_A01_bin.37]
MSNQSEHDETQWRSPLGRQEMVRFLREEFVSKVSYDNKITPSDL